MQKASITLAAVVAAGALAAPASARWLPKPVDPARIIHSEASYDLASGTTQTYSLKIKGLGEDFNVLLPCWGFDIHGGGVDLDVGQPVAFGPTAAPDPRRLGTPDGRVPGSQQQPDGSWVIPESVAVVGPVELKTGSKCAASGWQAYDDKGNPTDVLMPAWARSGANGGTASVSSKSKSKSKSNAKKKAKARKRVVHRGRSAQVTGAASVTLAGITHTADHSLNLVVRVTTGQLSGPAKLTMRGDVLRQASISAPEND